MCVYLFQLPQDQLYLHLGPSLGKWYVQLLSKVTWASISQPSLHQYSKEASRAETSGLSPDAQGSVLPQVPEGDASPTRARVCPGREQVG